MAKAPLSTSLSPVYVFTECNNASEYAVGVSSIVALSNIPSFSISLIKSLEATRFSK